jgi:hypothetical protein
MAPSEYHLFPGLKKTNEREAGRAKDLLAPQYLRRKIFYERPNILPATDKQLYEHAEYDKPDIENIISVTVLWMTDHLSD